MNSVDQTSHIRLELFLHACKCNFILCFVEPPLFVRPFESAELVTESEIILEAIVSGSPPFEISCFLNDKLIRNDKRHKISVENDTITLQISHCEAGDEGTYKCTVSNDVGETSCSCQISLKGLWRESLPRCMRPLSLQRFRISVSFRLPVNDNNICVFSLEPPSFVQRLKDMSCIVGSEISMKCMLSGSLPMTLSWIKDDRELTEDEHFKMSCETKSAMLNLKNAQLSHGGKYVCQAQNKAGTQRCAAVLIVTGLYDVRGSQSSAFAFVSSSPLHLSHAAQ